MSNVYSVEVISPDGRASDILPIELNDEAQAAAVVAILENLGTKATVMVRTRWAPVGGWPNQPPPPPTVMLADLPPHAVTLASWTALDG